MPISSSPPLSTAPASKDASDFGGFLTQILSDREGFFAAQRLSRFSAMVLGAPITDASAESRAANQSGSFASIF